MLDVVTLAALYHDIGKLAEQPQSILSVDQPDKNSKMLNHVDAGVACLLNEYEKTKNLAYIIAAFLVHGHHIGLDNFDSLIQEFADKSTKLLKFLYTPKNENFRDTRDIFETYGIGTPGKTVKQYIDEHIGDYTAISEAETGMRYAPKTHFNNIPVNNAQLRFVFSCLIDADHTDTDNFYSNQNYTPFKFNTLRPLQRRKRLEQHIKKLKITDAVSQSRLASRKALHKLCSTDEIPAETSFFALDGSVGLGKTYSGANYMLRLAAQKKCDRIYSIIPYTNIISQTVQDFRRALLFPNENENNVNEIHSKCEFEEIWMRKYSTRWNAPINVSTMVQFGESLTSNVPSQCRKLHWFANSVFFFDEFDKSMPHNHWKFILPVLHDMAESFNMSYIFSSGTSAYYWDIFNCNILVHHIIDAQTYSGFAKLENARCKMKILKSPVKNLKKFMGEIAATLETVNSAVIVCNTINNACMLAALFRESLSDYKVYELTGWQDTELKEKILAEVRLGLEDKSKKILLVATSTIECGVDISFDTGWREACSPLSLFQFAGRINRGAVAPDAAYYVFKFDESLVGKDCPFTENSQLASGISTFDAASKKDLTPVHCTHFVEEELSYEKGRERDFMRLETERQFKTLKKEFKVIDTATATVIVNKDLISRIQMGEKVAYNEIIRNSVQLWFTKLDKINGLVDQQLISEIGDDGYYAWNGAYDEQSGIGGTLIHLR